MQSNRLGRDISILFSFVAVFYIAAYVGLESLRSRKGPWEVEFERNDDGQPVFTITQKKLGIARFQLIFPEEKWTGTNQSQHITFDVPRQPPFEVPFGRVIYEDLTFLPGAVTFDLFGHEVELLPRTMIVNRHEQAWKSEAAITLWATNKVKSIKVPNVR